MNRRYLFPALSVVVLAAVIALATADPSRDPEALGDLGSVADALGVPRDAGGSVTVAAILQAIADRVPVQADLPRILHSPCCVEPGNPASVAVEALPGSICTITVEYPSENLSQAKGLQERRCVPSTGLVVFTWLVGSQTDPGRATISVNCQRPDHADTANAEALLQIGCDGS